jgi:glycosyltransferase involved in cell wall biosynthesis
VTAERPLVSCVLVTRDRPHFVTQAIRYFARQDYPRRELVVVDTGLAAAPLAVDDRVRRIRPDDQLTVGAARNLGAAAAHGDIIVHWDDDDWIGPHRLSRTVEHLETTGSLVTGLGQLVCYRPHHGDAWRYTPLAGDPPFLAGGTLAYRRSAWQRHPFPPLAIGEDAAFVGALEPGDVTALPDDGWYVALIHAGNTAPKNLADPRWSEVAIGEVADRIHADGAFYAAVRTGRLGRSGPAPSVSAGDRSDRSGERPRRPRPSGDAVTIAGDFLVHDGLGSMAAYAAHGLHRAGVDVRLAPLHLDRRGLAPQVVRLLDRAAEDGPTLYWSWPRPELEAYRTRPELFLRTAWESNALPYGWPEIINGTRAVIVPSTFVADVCCSSGVRVPVAVVPDGIDPGVYHYEDRPERETFTVLTVGTVIARKHLDAVMAAFERAFPGRRDARLVIKARFRAGHLTPSSSRVSVVDTDEPTSGIPHWYRRADVLVALGNEGFGLPVVEAMATGLPVIAMDAEGQADVCRDADGLLLGVPPAGRAFFDDPRYGRCGTAAVPDVDATARALRWVEAHRDEARHMGRAASGWATRHRNVWDMGRRVLDVMETHVSPPRTLRRSRVLWVTSWRKRCGVSDYVAQLARSLPDTVSVTADAPDPRRLRLLHVQHEDSLFDDATLSRYVERLDVPVVVTEHSVRSHRAWEDRADVLVALSDRGAALLRQRAGGRRVVRMHLGCPTWFPPRKTTRGRVIGSFGFLEPHKGFFALAAAVRRLAGAELVLYSHPKTPALGAEFTAAIEGLRARWYPEFLPVETIAQRLASECDALVFWYDEVALAAASSAVRVALATGVPVLASPTGWFSDLTDVTYQPANLLDGVERILTDSELRDGLTAAARDYCEAHAWQRTAAEHLALWESVESA